MLQENRQSVETLRCCVCCFFVVWWRILVQFEIQRDGRLDESKDCYFDGWDISCEGGGGHGMVCLPSGDPAAPRITKDEGINLCRVRTEGTTRIRHGEMLVEVLFPGARSNDSCPLAHTMRESCEREVTEIFNWGYGVRSVAKLVLPHLPCRIPY